MEVKIDEQNDIPRIKGNKGTLVYSEKSDTLYIKTHREGIKAIGADTSITETDPIYLASSWSSTTNNSSNWDTAYGWGNHASAGYLTSLGIGSLTQAWDADLDTIAALTGTGFLKRTGTNTWTLDTNTYLTSISGLNISLLTNDSGYITSSALSPYVPTIRNLTINSVTYDLSADRSWTISAGISTLNTLTGSTQTFATGTTGTDFTISSSGTTHTFNIPTASSSNRGVLSTTDWTTFNSKESALTFSTGLTRTSNTITSDISTGVSGGQTIIGGTASGNSLTLSSTSNATKGKLLFGTSAYDEVNNRLGIGNTSPSYALDVNGDIRVNNIYRFQAGQSFSVSGSAININADNGTVWNANSSGSTLLTLSNGGIYGFTAGFVTGYTNPFIALGVKRESGTNWRAYLAYPITFQNLAGDIAITQDTGKTYGGTFTPTETVRLKAGGTVGIGVTSPSAYLSIKASTTSIPHLNLTAGSAPSSPTNGDIWFDGSDIKMRIGGVTKTFTLT